MGLPVDSGIPVVGMVTRLAVQKGIRELAAPGEGSLFSILSDFNVQFAVLGSGEKWCENELSYLSSVFPNLSVWIGYNEKLAHLIEGGSDFFLMPSRYEPCGLNQIYSLRYGAIPIVRNTGGWQILWKTMIRKQEAEPGSCLMILTRGFSTMFSDGAVSTWYDRRSHITKMRKKGMVQDYSWKKSADIYLDLYKKSFKNS